MYYLTTYTYIEQLKHRRKLGFKYNTIEEIIIFFYCYNIAYKIVQWLKSEEFKKIIKEYKEKKQK